MRLPDSPDSHEPCSCGSYPELLHVYWMYHSEYITKGRLWPLFLPTPPAPFFSFFPSQKKSAGRVVSAQLWRATQNIASSPCLPLQALLLRAPHQGMSLPNQKWSKHLLQQLKKTMRRKKETASHRPQWNSKKPSPRFQFQIRQVLVMWLLAKVPRCPVSQFHLLYAEIK